MRLNHKKAVFWKIWQMFTTSAYFHQIEAYEKLKYLKVGALFADMGTGKTRIAFELFADKMRRKKVIKVCYITPFSTMKSVDDEFKKHFISLPDYIIFAYESIQASDRLYLDVLKLVDNSTFLIMDESHFIRNDNIKRTARIYEIAKRCQYKLIMTGTPIPKNIGNLYSQFKVLDSRILGYKSFDQFASNHLVYRLRDNFVIASKNIEFVSQRIAPYVYQIKKSECLDLPEKIQYTRIVSMDEGSIDEYQQIKEKYFNTIMNEEYVVPGLIFAMFTELQQVCDLSEGKYYDLQDVLQEIKGKQVIIYFKFLNSLKRTKELLNEKAYEFSGQLNLHERNNNLQKWIENSSGILLITYGTGSFSLNLQSCSDIIYLNQTFDYAQKLQSQDRIHRIGQINSCNYINIITNAGIENILEKSENKKYNVIKEFTDKINSIKKEKDKDVRKELQNLWERYI